jgi:squalene-hopene cyclase-like protein/prenyltransferase/squalene oxidase-like repeat protein
MFHKNPKLVEWFTNNLPYDPIKVLYHGYHAPIRYDLYKNYLLFEHDDAALHETEQDVKTAQRRVNLLLTLERILKNLHKFDADREEEMLLKLASIVKELRFYNCNRKMTSTQRALAELIKFQKEDGSFPVSLAGNVFIIETILEYGVVNNPYVEKALKWLLKQQNDDKGWGTTNDGHSDVWITTKVLHAFSFSMKYMKNTKIRKGIEFVLSHLYVENSGGIVEGKQAWENFSGDYMLEGSYIGGILSVLEMCARLNVSYEDPRVSEMLDWLKSKQLQSGHWPSQTYDIFFKTIR